MSVNIRQLKKAHYVLIAQYIDILNQVSKLPFFVPLNITAPSAKNDRSNSNIVMIKTMSSPFSLRYLVRLFAESHIKRKLNELSVAYSYFAGQNPKDKSLLSWLKKTSEECDKLAATLTSWQSIRGAVSALWPFGIGIATASLGLENSYDVVKMIDFDAFDWLTLGAMVFPLIYVAIFMSTSFQKKRELFLPGFNQEEKPMNDNAKIEDTVYYYEDQVFDLLGRGKVHEIPADVIGQAVGFLGFAVLELTQVIVNTSVSVKILFGVATGMFLLFAIISVRQGFRRKWS